MQAYGIGSLRQDFQNFNIALPEICPADTSIVKIAFAVGQANFVAFF
jgi:hypothetical protein